MNKKLIIIIGILIIPCIILGILLINKKGEKNVVWNESEIANAPILLEGMEAITFEYGKETPIILEKEEAKQGIWYDYNQETNKWANSKTKDRKYVGMDSKICL